MDRLITFEMLSPLSINTPKDFKTHYIYLDFLKNESTNLSIISKYKLTKKNVSEFGKLIESKIKLIDCFKKSLDDEFESIKNCNEFAEFNNTWIATKSYYLLFHMWCLIFCLIDNNPKMLKYPHTKMLKLIKENIEEQKLKFTNNKFNLLKSYIDVEIFTCSPGANLKENYDTEEIFFLILKKISNYKLEDFKRNNNIPNFRKKLNKDKRDKYKEANKNNLLEFFYMYRIKTDYKDVNFLNNCTDLNLHFKYYENYYNLTNNFFKALKNLINELSLLRYDGEILI